MKTAIFKFKPFSRKQRMILNWWADNSPVKDKQGIIADGAIRSGKTVSMSLSFVMWAMYRFDGQNFAMCGKTVGSFRRNVLSTLKLTLTSRGYKVEDKRADNLVIVSRGNKTNYFYVFGGQDERSQDLIQGITLAGLFLDEVALMPESFVNQATGRCSVEGSKFFFNCNPGGPMHWFKTGWIDQRDKKELLYLHFTMDDNLSLSEEIKTRYRNMYAGVFFLRYIKGLWAVAEGLIYTMFDNDNLYDTLPEATRYASSRMIAVDYGTTNPCVFLDTYDDGQTIWVEREYRWDSRSEEARRSGNPQKTDKQYADDMAEFMGTRPDEQCTIIVDPSAASFIQELRSRGWVVKPADNEVLDGIRKVSTMMSRKSLRINRNNCRGLIAEIQSYVWDDKAAERGEEKPVKQMDHCVTGDTIIDTDKGPIQIKDLVGKTGKVYCTDGENRICKKFKDVRMTQKNAEVFELKLKNGLSVKATADHPILTERGWIQLIDLRTDDKVACIGGIKDERRVQSRFKKRILQWCEIPKRFKNRLLSCHSTDL